MCIYFNNMLVFTIRLLSSFALGGWSFDSIYKRFEFIKESAFGVAAGVGFTILLHTGIWILDATHHIHVFILSLMAVAY